MVEGERTLYFHFIHLRNELISDGSDYLGFYIPSADKMSGTWSNWLTFG